MAISYTQLNVGTGPDTGDGQSLRSGGILINDSFAVVYQTINNLITALGVVDENSVDLGTFTGATISDGRTVKQALQELETYVEALNVLDAGYVAGTATLPVAGDTIEGAIAKLHGMLSAIDQAVVLRGTWDAAGGAFPGSGTAQAGDSYIVSGPGTVDSISFVAGDRIIAITDNASTTTFAANWFKADYTDQVGSVFGRQGAVVAQTGDYTASQITNTPAGDIAATNVQAAINELDGDKVAVSLLAAKGSIISASAASTPQEVGVGVDGEALTADAATSSGLRYTAQVSRSVPVANMATNTLLGAAASVDVATHLVFVQTTVGITATIPDPTNASKHRTVQLSNIGSTLLTIQFANGPAGFVLAPENTVAITWTGAAWSIDENRLVTIADYISVYRSSDVTVASQAPILFNTVLNGNIPYDSLSGTFTLAAGKTYLLSSNTLVRNGDSTLSVAWYNVTAGAYMSPSGATVAANHNTSFDGSNQAVVTFTPTVTTQVQLRNNMSQARIMAGGPIGINGAAASQATIVQIGSTAFTGLNDQSASGYLDIGGMRMQWGVVTVTGGTGTINMPAAFADMNYSVVASHDSLSDFVFAVLLKNSASQFRLDPRTGSASATGSLRFSWQAIGLKP